MESFDILLFFSTLCLYETVYLYTVTDQNQNSGLEEAKPGGKIKKSSSAFTGHRRLCEG